MSLLLDTDTVIFLLKDNAEVQKNLRLHIHDPIKISVVSIMELYYGAYKSANTTANIATVRRLETALDVLPVGLEVGSIFGSVKAGLEKAGTPLDDLDLIIASTALAHNLRLVTNNMKHFRRIKGLRLSNWVTNPREQ